MKYLATLVILMITVLAIPAKADVASWSMLLDCGASATTVTLSTSTVCGRPDVPGLSNFTGLYGCTFAGAPVLLAPAQNVTSDGDSSCANPSCSYSYCTSTATAEFAIRCDDISYDILCGTESCPLSEESAGFGYRSFCQYNPARTVAPDGDASDMSQDIAYSDLHGSGDRSTSSDDGCNIGYGTAHWSLVAIFSALLALSSWATRRLKKTAGR